MGKESEFSIGGRTMLKFAELNAELRELTGTRAVKKLRLKNLIPAVIYGKGLQNLNISINKFDWLKLMRTGNRTFSIKCNNNEYKVLLKEIQWDVLGNNVIHLDFQSFTSDMVIELEVPIVIKGTPKGLKEGGFLKQFLHSIKLKGKFADMPEKIEIDVTNLALNDKFHISDLTLPEKLQSLLPKDSLIVAVTKAKEEVAEAAKPQEQAPQITEPEIIKRERKEKEEEEEEREK